MGAGGFLVRVAILGAAVPWMVASAEAALEACAPVVGELVSVEGEVEVQRADASRWQRAELGESLCERDSVRVNAHSRAAVALVTEAVLRLDENTTVNLRDIAVEEEERSFLDLIAGALQSFSRRPRLLAVDTPYLNATIEGTEFVIRVEAERSVLTVFEGLVTAANDEGEVRVSGGGAAVAQAGRAPQPLVVVRPRDAAQWALYYPPILAAVGGGQAERRPPDLPPALEQALALADRGETAGALERLDRVPAAERDATFHLYRAALLLSVGRVDEAEAAIERALAADPGAGLAHALRAVIEVARNEEDRALASARRAVELSPDAAAAKIALSYALQANFELEAARDALLQAVEEDPDDALAWARLAELWQALGYRDRAREAAERAAALAPDVERVHVVRGFALLVEFRTAAAKEAFARAIALDPADPLPRLGLGLAQIREGDLQEGRGNIEVAAGLNPNNALVRAYLGKAYFEERRNELAAQQYAIAKELDPLDPTPYLYDALRKQTENRPVEALDDLQTSIELNDNRAVYRSRLQLDEDRASRGGSIARVYDDLGFQDLGVKEAGRSLTFDPSAASAHRFLSDTYRGVRRREIARVSELLQAQLLQHININPVQPSLSETSLNVATGGGPAEPGFNEFTPLFERNQAQLNLSGVVGDEDTLGGEAVVSALYDRYSLSAGAFHFQTDGFRPNFDFRHDIYNVFGQAAITPELNVQAEFRHRETEEGDLVLAFDPDDFLRQRERTLDQDIARAGLRYSPAPHSDVLLSFIYSERDEVSSRTEPFFEVFELTADARSDDEGYQAEGQYIYRADRFNVVAGLAFSDVDRDGVVSFALDGVPAAETVIDTEITHPRGYLYGNLNFPDPVLWTVGVSYDDYDQEGLDVEEVNPKFGVQWNITDDVLLRGAVFKIVKPALVNNRTIEPTQVAGFNQYYDDINATESLRYGFGFDWRLTEDFFIGAEATWRDLDEPLRFEGDFIFEERDEQLHRAYLYWTPLPWLAASAELAYDLYESERGIATDEDNLPLEVETISVPLGLRYFAPNGLFAGLGATYVHQEVDRSPVSTRAEGTDEFFVVDASVGYRFPNRIGLVSLEVRNLFDTEFNFQDDSFREFRDEPSIGPYIPDREIRARLTLNF